MAEELVLYTNPMSRGRIATWMLEEVGVPYRAEYLAFGEPMKSPAYLKVNPMGKVPAIRHGDAIVTECAAICAYLADAFPTAGLAPARDRRGDYYRWLFFAAGPLEMSVTNHSLGFEAPPERLGMVGCGTYGDVMGTLEKAVSTGPYIAGERFTAADVYVGAHISWGLQFGSIENRPAFVDYWNRLKDRPAHLRATELDDAQMARMQNG
ncbi:glutathione S-transferase family protein [Rhizobiaceae bacterium n13]|uniref:Glutathione S-transferase family protein n=1 Tax=Ferirhizobium litorale TaxID=2927786 RepID=A0AAE3QEE1_9HYPH|nr:glutathione S-transferase family protein [Fererhizobium litorale]MDI7863911.1 glutathione S-transferase family protein [Fererhizobium litorale]MDI7924257.1 glutathione S-transferase family protein [Fererhizobium litorale]